MKQLIKTPLRLGFFLIVISLGCSKEDYDFSIVEPIYQRHHLKEVLIDGVLNSVIYWDEAFAHVDSIEYYQNGLITSKELFEYGAEGLLNRREAIVNEQIGQTWDYEYDNQNRLASLRSCAANDDCTELSYDYSQRTSCDLQSIQLSSTSFVNNQGESFRYIYDYTYSNFGNCSYTQYTNFATDEASTPARLQTRVVTKSVDLYLNPYFHIYPESDPYIDWNILTFDNIQGILSQEEYVPSIEVNESKYPTQQTYATYDASQNTTTESVYSYEYY